MNDRFFHIAYASLFITLAFAILHFAITALSPLSLIDILCVTGAESISLAASAILIRKAYRV